MDISSFGALERSGWGDAGLARSYATGFAAAALQAVPATLAAVSPVAGRRVLDLCTGHGIVAEALAGAGAEVTGLDFSPAMLEMARARVPGARFIQGDVLDLDLPDAGFDAATMGFGMLHMPDPDAALAEVRRILRPGGVFAFSVWDGPARPSALAIVLGTATALGDPAITLPPGPQIFAFADPEHADARLAAAGFDQITREVVDSAWQIDRPDRPVDFMIEGTVRGAALLRAQPPDRLAAIREAVAEKIIGMTGPDGPWTVPVPAIVTRAVAH